MNKNTALKLLTPILALLVINQVLTGVFVLSMSPKAFQLLHRGGGMVFVVAVGLHVILNWAWIRASFFKRKGAA